MLKINNLDFGYNKKADLFKGLSLSIKEGEVLSLLGLSGCGKSTLGRLITGFETPLNGEISIDGEYVFKKGGLNKKAQERSVSVVFQDFGLFPFMSVEENIRMWTESDMDQNLLKSLKLEGLINRKVVTLSGGQKQRVGLARALNANPKLLILDEPLSQLDELTKYQFLDYFSEIKKKMTCLWITHNPQIALKMSHKTCYLSPQGLSGPVGASKENLLSLHSDLKSLTKFL